jgi:hypothetical protein
MDGNQDLNQAGEVPSICPTNQSCSSLIMSIAPNHYDDGGLEQVRHLTNNVNQAPASEAGDKHPFLSLWMDPVGVGAMFYLVWSANLKTATAMATRLMEAITPGQIWLLHIHTMELSDQFLAEAKSKIEMGKPLFDEKGDTNSYVVLEVRGEGDVTYHFPHSTSSEAASKLVRKEVGNSAVLRTFRLAPPLLLQVKSLMDSGKSGLIPILPTTILNHFLRPERN